MAKPEGVLANGALIKVANPTGEPAFFWYEVYEFPKGSGQYISYQYNGYGQVVKAHGEELERTVRSQDWFEKHVVAEGEAESVIGQPGGFYNYINNIIKDEAAKAGINDPTLWGKIANNREMQIIMGQALEGNWEPAEILAAQRQTNFWKNVLYPGIENLYDRSLNPERDYREYVGQVSNALDALGYERDADGTFGKQIKKMLNKGIQADVFTQMVPTFIRATQNEAFATTLNAWAERDLGRNIGFDDWFNLMQGESQPDLEAVAERATLQWVADNQGTGLSQSEIESLADRTQFSVDDAQRAFSDFNQSILALGSTALGRYGLTRDEVLSATAGVTPESGRTVDEVKQLIAKTAREQGLADDAKINFYIGYDPQGKPIRPGLQSLAPEGA